ncbi:sensor domain-containing diguanylate cyclase [Paenibacillus roseipurpureus]|uniref:Diguanylate cyclase n=1 Tax=Paenibacillus roseopurpureus TaxID=2918901 RepID=A0AA96LMM0_9BACL|nr:diguanylate cyclase [Paenibacillus sp. MBLB1832]WNR44535.1 diguanylate cyclase [Paenibacillus sp. MBLB1832]
MTSMRCRRQAKPYYWVLVIAMLLTSVACNAVPSGEALQHPKAVQGTLNMEHVGPEQVIALDGEWGFYWKRLISPGEVDIVKPDDYVAVPKAWSQYQLPSGKPNPAGYGTYVLHVHHAAPNKVWAIDIPAISSAYSLWVDGKLLLQNGKVSESPELTGVHIEQRLITFESTDTSIDIVMQVSNGIHPRGGITRSVMLGDANSIIGDQQKRLAFELFLSGALIIMAVYHLGLYVMRTKEKEALFFGMYCFVIALRSLLIGEVFIYKLLPWLDWAVALKKIEFLCLTVGVLSFAQFLKAIYPQEMSRNICRFITAVCLLYSTIIACMSPLVFTSLLIYFQFMIIGFVTYGFIVFLMAMIHRREGAKISVTGGTILIVSIINDILYYRGIVQTGNYVTLGLFAFVVAQSFILASKFSKAFTHSEEMAHELRGLNNSLERKVQERTNKLVEINELLRIQSSLDGLTGIANRGYFDQMLQTMLTDSRNNKGVLSLLLIDIDNFKSYNDRYGHLQGDACLREVALLLQSEAKEWSGFAARYGGEEFAVIAPIDAAAAARLAATLVRRTYELQIVHAASVTAPFVTISCGVTTYTAVKPEVCSAGSLIEAADEALYKVKRQGRNGYCVASGLPTEEAH